MARRIHGGIMGKGEMNDNKPATYHPIKNVRQLWHNLRVYFRWGLSIQLLDWSQRLINREQTLDMALARVNLVLAMHKRSRELTGMPPL